MYVFGSSTEGLSVADIRVACLYTLDLLPANIYFYKLSHHSINIFVISMSCSKWLIREMIPN